jgi:hypothetical protein
VAFFKKAELYHKKYTAWGCRLYDSLFKKRRGNDFLKKSHLLLAEAGPCPIMEHKQKRTHKMTDVVTIMT